VQRFLDAYDPIAGHFRPRHHLWWLTIQLARPRMDKERPQRYFATIVASTILSQRERRGLAEAS